MQIGQLIELLVSEDDTSRPMTARVLSWLASIILFSISMPFGCVGASFLLYNKRKRGMHDWLLEYGTPV